MSRQDRRFLWPFLADEPLKVVGVRARRSDSGAWGQEWRAVKAGRRPPVGEALRARSSGPTEWPGKPVRASSLRLVVREACSRGVGGQDALRLLSSARRCWRGQAGDPGCRSSLRPNSDMEWFGRSQVGSIKTAATPQGGGHDYWRARTGLRPVRVSPLVGQTADFAVA